MEVPGSTAARFVVQNVFVPRALLQEEWQERGNTECVRRDVHFDGDAGLIVAVHEPNDAGPADPAITVIDGTNKLLLPGFLNGHTHSGEMYNRGAIPPLPLELWLGYLWDHSPQDPALYYLSALLNVAVEGLKTGVTCVLDMPSVMGSPGQEFECLEAVCRAYREVGIRAFVCPLVGDLPFDAAVAYGCGHGRSPYAGTDKHDPRKTDWIMAFMQNAVEKLHRPEEGIEIGVGPTGMQMCSDELFTRCRELSEKHGLVRHTHLLETVNQKKLAVEKYGCSAVEHLAKLGFFNEKTTCAHSVWLDSNDIEVLKTTGATPVHNPLSNLRLGSGIAPVLKYLDAKINVCFGCDGASSNDSQDMLEAIKMGAILHNITDFDYTRWITPDQVFPLSPIEGDVVQELKECGGPAVGTFQAFRMAAMGGARAVGLQDKTGLVEVGRSADLVLFDLANSLSILPRTDILGLLLLGRPNNLVTDVWVRGRRVVSNGKVAGVDEEKLKRDLFASSDWNTMPRTSATRTSVEQRYRQVMVDTKDSDAKQ
ncbi:amidohydrolase family protein [Acanthamoeba castellanii str. Neff]|uniref:Amidohydrolase family protein n=1 Tax=Acanthamoeba castellanii (strain ATCC 30010 / Neff) TaxID=1257118 RepID=L8H421_ACACF|nr:amidohydrolase family protein [Acanthamoeba castellanii str. Neff]ELR19967.1 amidohydrolase family protein [Acanthamoeba castellanii str. Neff]